VLSAARNRLLREGALIPEEQAEMRAQVRTGLGPKRCGHDVLEILMSIDAGAIRRA